MIKEKSVGAIIFYLENNKPMFLLLRYPNYWGFVKGNVEKEETDNEKKTLVREAREEANLNKLVFVEGFRERIHYLYKKDGKLISKEVIFLLCETHKKEAAKVKVSWEHKGFKWLPYNDALALLKHKNEIEIFKKADKFLSEYSKQRKLFLSVKSNLSSYYFSFLPC
jgi:8-oxo-dGTP pyrophosphatase MutT (NUDIX family)